MSSATPTPALATSSSTFLPTTLDRKLASFGLESPVGRYLAAAGIGLGVVGLIGASVCWLGNRRREAIRSCRPLHWVFKVGDLEKTVRFYEKVFGMTVQRHEEFDKGCAATCNGPYSGWWSKTMMSVTSEEDFSIELTYNYGIDSYASGNDLVGIHVAIPGASRRARESGIELHPTSDSSIVKIQNPDGQWFFLHDAPQEEGADPFLYVSLNTADLKKATDYYVNVLGMKLFNSTSTTSLVGYASNRTKLELIQLPAGVSVDHRDAFGRIAFGNNEVVPTYERVVAAGDTVLNAPITLETPNKANVTVAILADRDGNEICMVDDNEFRRLCERKPGDEIINWTSRAKRIAAQQKFAKSFARH